ncbi:YheC/YheD family protein [Neobacillus drentensis]|uniref:YheC/YheD family endospore coat-associated protein n=1 Tax=Neobacillus drentensis TaxID=220684 RepID=UPI001F2A5556|nr:YheC/YheD family protein [Neobacillus drentensis]ULT58054.1 YheC/YheD family protein [Neobacillus drentensis]
MKTDGTPLIGILTARKSKGTIAGNGPLFIEIQKKLISLNGVSFVFTPEDVEDDFIYGYYYSPEENRWKKKSFPFPDLVYNRIPFRTSEQEEKSKWLFSRLKEKNIPFFNPCFIDKYELYQLLKGDHILQNYLPKTILVQRHNELLNYLMEFGGIYLKPTQSSKGKGIVRLRMDGPSGIQLDGILKQKTYSSFTHFWEEWNEELLKKRYIAQEEIQSAEYEGKRFDFRILAHANHNDYTLSGVGIRLSQEQEITTHISSGGSLLPYQLLKSKEHDVFFQTIIPSVGKSLSNYYGYFGEFTIDAGVSKTGRYYIYEVNSKPMSFDEEEIEKKKIENLCCLFLQLIEESS